MKYLLLAVVVVLVAGCGAEDTEPDWTRGYEPCGAEDDHLHEPAWPCYWTGEDAADGYVVHDDGTVQDVRNGIVIPTTIDVGH